MQSEEGKARREERLEAGIDSCEIDSIQRVGGAELQRYIDIPLADEINRFFANFDHESCRLVVLVDVVRDVPSAELFKDFVLGCTRLQVPLKRYQSVLVCGVTTRC